MTTRVAKFQEFSRLETFHGNYIYAFSRRFYPKRLSVHSCYTYFCQYMCSLGIEPTTFALLTQCSNHWATGINGNIWELTEINGNKLENSKIAGTGNFNVIENKILQHNLWLKQPDLMQFQFNFYPTHCSTHAHCLLQGYWGHTPHMHCALLHNMNRSFLKSCTQNINMFILVRIHENYI